MTEATNNTKRLFQYDFLRATAMIFVVAVHSLVVIDFSNKIALSYFYIMQSIFFTSNGIFFMLSGKFALEKSRICRDYYARKATNILIPAIVYMSLRTFFINYVSPYNGGVTLFILIKNILGDLANTEYWFLYTLIGCLVIAPILSTAVRNMTVNEHTAFICVFALYGAIRIISQLLSLPFQFKFIFFDWSFYFYLGFAIEKIATKFKPSCKLLLIMGSCSLFLTTVLVYYGLNLYIHDLSPIFMLLIISTYFLLGKLSLHIPKKLHPLFSFMARYSFGVYLCHMMVLESIQQIISVRTGVKSLESHILITAVTIAISLFISFTIDKTIIRFLRSIVTKASMYLCN